MGSRKRATQRLACEAAVARFAKEPGLRTELHQLLRGGSQRARFAAAFVLFQVERPTLRLLPTLLDALELDDGDVRWSATHMLSALGRLQSEVLPVLLHEARKAESPLRRRMALYCLRELAPEGAETEAALLDALTDRDAEVRRAALSSLGKLREPDRACVDRVLESLAEDADPRMRRIAAVLVPGLLRHHPDAGAQARTALERAAHSEDRVLARCAHSALARVS